MKNLKVVKIAHDHIEFSNGLTLSSDHLQDCCENHYLDFEHISIEDFENLEFDLSVENGEKFFNKIEDYGIELIPVHGWSVKIPGYGSNNGYYSTNLSLVLSDGREFDISECQDIGY